MTVPARAVDKDLFQQAVNYVFTGMVAPQKSPEIVDRKSCIVVASDPKSDGYIRYYLKRFRMDEALFQKTYSGSRANYHLDVKGDEYVVAYLNADKHTVTQQYRSAQIPLPGDIDQTRKAFRINFTDYCSAQNSSGPF